MLGELTEDATMDLRSRMTENWKATIAAPRAKHVPTFDMASADPTTTTTRLGG